MFDQIFSDKSKVVPVPLGEDVDGFGLVGIDVLSEDEILYAKHVEKLAIIDHKLEECRRTIITLEKDVTNLGLVVVLVLIDTESDLHKQKVTTTIELRVLHTRLYG